MKIDGIEALQQRIVAPQATGCSGAAGYLDFAEANGYEFVEVLNWCSSAGDWQFIVSKNEFEWFIMWQENNWPRPGFERAIEDEEGDQCYCGSAAEVLELIYEMWG